MSVMKVGIYGSGYHIVHGLIEGLGINIYRSTPYFKKTAGNKKLKCRVAQVAAKMNLTKTIQIMKFEDSTKDCHAIGNSFLPGRVVLIVPKGFSRLPPGVQECVITYELTQIKNNYHFIEGILGACLYMITRVGLSILFPASRLAADLLQIVIAFRIAAEPKFQLEKTRDQETFSLMSSSGKKEVASSYNRLIFGSKNSELMTKSLSKRVHYVFEQAQYLKKRIRVRGFEPPTPSTPC